MAQRWGWTVGFMAQSQYYFRDVPVFRASLRSFALLSILAIITLATVWCNDLKADLLVIAHPDVPVEQLTMDQLSAIYLSRMRRWPGGEKIIPVNREASSQTRSEFSRLVFKEPPEALADYWAKMQFKGVRPPLIQESDSGVLLFVQRVPGAIAYVNKGVPLDGVKVLISLPSE